MILALIQAIIDGLLMGGVYATIAVGLSLSFGVMRIINWAQGEFLMVAMYIAFLLVNSTGADPYLTLFVPALVMFVIGFFLQKFIFNRMLDKDKSREPISILLFTAGLGIVLTNVALIIFGGLPISAITSYVGKAIYLGGLVISVPRLISFVIALVLTLALNFVLQGTELGRAIRATSQNREISQLMGINHKLVYCVTFGIGLALLGASASLLVPFYSVSPTMGSNFGFKSFIIVVLGGKGSIAGCLLGGVIIGLIEKIGALYWSDANAQILVFVLFVVILLFKPNGLLSTDKDA